MAPAGSPQGGAHRRGEDGAAAGLLPGGRLPREVLRCARLPPGAPGDFPRLSPSCSPFLIYPGPFGGVQGDATSSCRMLGCRLHRVLYVGRSRVAHPPTAKMAGTVDLAFRPRTSAPRAPRQVGPLTPKGAGGLQKASLVEAVLHISARRIPPTRPSLVAWRSVQPHSKGGPGSPRHLPAQALLLPL